MTYKMTIQGHVPSKSNCYRIGFVGGHYSLVKTAALQKYEKSFFLQCPYRNLKSKKLFSLTLNVYYESMRSDLDNAFKIVLDCLQNPCHVIENDNKCVEIFSHKYIDKENPRVEIEIFEFDV